MKIFETSFANVVIRFYLVMGIIIGAFFAGVPALSLIVLPIYLAALLGLKFRKDEPVQNAANKKVNLASIKTSSKAA